MGELRAALRREDDEDAGEDGGRARQGRDVHPSTISARRALWRRVLEPRPSAGRPAPPPSPAEKCASRGYSARRRLLSPVTCGYPSSEGRRGRTLRGSRAACPGSRRYQPSVAVRCKPGSRGVEASSYWRLQPEQGLSKASAAPLESFHYSRGGNPCTLNDSPAAVAKAGRVQAAQRGPRTRSSGRTAPPGVAAECRRVPAREWRPALATPWQRRPHWPGVDKPSPPAAATPSPWRGWRSEHAAGVAATPWATPAAAAARAEKHD